MGYNRKHKYGTKTGQNMFCALMQLCLVLGNSYSNTFGHHEETAMNGETSFGEWLRQQRKSLDLTQQSLAHLVGCSPDLVRKIEGGVRRPSRQVAALLAEAL